MEMLAVFDRQVLPQFSSPWKIRLTTTRPHPLPGSLKVMDVFEGAIVSTLGNTVNPLCRLALVTPLRSHACPPISVPIWVVQFRKVFSRMTKKIFHI
jgi:hypothetical protein